MGGDNSKENIATTINKTVFNSFVKTQTSIFQTIDASQSLVIRCNPTPVVVTLFTATCDSCFRAYAAIGKTPDCVTVCNPCTQIGNTLDAEYQVNADITITNEMAAQVAADLKAQAAQNFKNQSDFISAESLSVLAGADGSVRNVTEITNDIANNVSAEVLTEMRQLFITSQSLTIEGAAGSQNGNRLKIALVAAGNISSNSTSYNESVTKASAEISQTLENKSSTLGALDTLAGALGVSAIALYVIIAIVVIVIGVIVFSVFRKKPASPAMMPQSAR
jgi:hypothetical protein